MMPTFDLLRIPPIFIFDALPIASCSEQKLTEDTTLPVCVSVGAESNIPYVAPPGAVADSTGYSYYPIWCSPSAGSTELAPSLSRSVSEVSDGEYDPGITSLRDLIEEGAEELETALKRITSIELEHQELQSQLDKAIMQRSNDADAIADLKAELRHAQELIAALTDIAARRDITLNTMERNVSESLERANLAMSKLNSLEDYVERWLGEDIRKKQEADAAARKKREEKEMRKRAQEAARLERERTEREEQLRRAEAKAAEEARLQKAADARREKELVERLWEMSMLDRWEQYQEPYCQGELTFENIVWPVPIPPTDLSGITEDAVECFLFSEIHSTNRKRHQRFNDAIKRWNPTRYADLEARVKPCDRNIVEQAFHAITMHLRALRDMRAKSADV